MSAPAHPTADEVFSPAGDDLRCDGVSLRAIVAEVGSPTYVYSARAVRERARAFRAISGERPFRFKYAVKANTHRQIIGLLAAEGFGADVVSEGELRAALSAGVPPAEVVYPGVGKTAAEIRSALAQGVGFLAVESLWEMEEIARQAAAASSASRALVRTNVDVDGSTHPYLTTGRTENKFGIDVELVRERFAAWQRELPIPLVGVQTHIGSQITDPSAFREAAKAVRALVGDLRASGARVEVVDFGGGLGVPYDGKSSLDLDAYGAIVRELAADLDVELMLEPGRYLVAEAGIAVGTVLHHKHGREKDFLVTDLAMNDLIRPALYHAHHRILPVAPQTRPPCPRPVDVVGPVCESGDYVGLARSLPVLEPGDLIAVLTAGAYGYGMSSNYNMRPRPAEVLVDDGSFRVITPRESLDDLLR